MCLGSLALCFYSAKTQMCVNVSVSVCLYLVSTGRNSQSHGSVSTGPGPTEPTPPAASPELDQSAAPTVQSQLTRPSQPRHSQQSSVYSVLLRSGALCLPGKNNTPHLNQDQL